MINPICEKTVYASNEQALSSINDEKQKILPSLEKLKGSVCEFIENKALEIERQDLHDRCHYISHHYYPSHYYYRPYYSPCYVECYPTTGYNHCPSRSDNTKDKKAKQSSEALVIGAIILVVGSVFAVLSGPLIQQKEESLKKIATLKEEFSMLQTTSNLTPFYQKIKENVYDPLLSTYERTVSKVNQYGMEFVGVMAGGTFLAVGGTAMNSTCITAGYVLVAFSIAASVYTFFAHSNDSRRDLSEHMNVNANLDELLKPSGQLPLG